MKAKAPNGGWMLLEPFPDPEGQYRVDVLDQALVVLPAGEPSSVRTKRWERHRCGPARGVRPERRPQQLVIEDPA